MSKNLWLSDAEILEQLGLRIKNERLRSNISQQDLARELSVSEGTVRNIEKGKNVSLENFIRIVRFFSELDKLDSFFQTEEISPKELFEARSLKKRQRASR